MNSLCLPSHRLKSHGRSRAKRRPSLVRASPLSRHQGLVSREGKVMRCALGRSGLAALKREGDGATPRARVVPVLMLRRGAPGRYGIAERRIRPRDGWCDDAGSAGYNLPCAAGIAASHERLWRDDALYDFCVVTDHNQRPRVRGAGSAIFVHVARPALSATEGCLAFPMKAWRAGQVAMAPWLIGSDPRPV